ncbi:MAG: zinc-binding dehydrogenase [Candidatus Neomarinimicrobiota bacterium]
MKTTAAVLTELNQPLQILELDLPDLHPGQVLVEMAYSGICHTQLNEIRGKKGPDKFLPHTLGHEGSGRVVATGAQVAKVAPGDRVVCTWLKGSGADVPSAQYFYRGAKVNSGAISTFLTNAVISENRLVVIPAGMPLREAALLGCAIPTGVGIVRNSLQVGPGNSLAVFGAGGIGLSAIMTAAALGAGPIIAVDVFDHKLEQARSLGATHVINGKTTSAAAEIHAVVPGGVDFAIEATGSTTVMEAAFASIKNSGQCIIAGNPAAGEKICLDPFDLIKGKRIYGSWGGASDPDRDIPAYVELYLSADLPLERLITHEFTLSEINAAFTELEQGRVGRAIVKLEHD